MAKQLANESAVGDDVLLCGTTLPQLASMREDLADEAKKVGPGLHFGTTQTLGRLQVRRGVSAAQQVLVQDHTVEVLPHEASVAYLGRAAAVRDIMAQRSRTGRPRPGQSSPYTKANSAVATAPCTVG